MLFDVGDPVRCAVVFVSDPDTPTSYADPTTVTVVVDPPGTGRTTYATPDSHIVKDSTGHYHHDFTATKRGRWRVTWTGGGALVAVAEIDFLANE